MSSPRLTVIDPNDDPNPNRSSIIISVGEEIPNPTLGLIFNPTRENPSSQTPPSSSYSASNEQSTTPNCNTHFSLRNSLDLKFPCWYHLFINIIEPTSTLIAIFQLFFWPKTFLEESLPGLLQYYSYEGTQPLLTELGGAWWMIVFIEMFLLSPFKGISPLSSSSPQEEDEDHLQSSRRSTTASSSSSSPSSLHLKIWQTTLGALLISDGIYYWSLAQASPLSWAGVLLPWNWTSGLQATTVLLSLIGSATRIAFLAGVGFKRPLLLQEGVVLV